jgi:hypothetical protein
VTLLAVVLGVVLGLAAFIGYCLVVARGLFEEEEDEE